MRVICGYSQRCGGWAVLSRQPRILSTCVKAFPLAGDKSVMHRPVEKWLTEGSDHAMPLRYRKFM